MDARALAFRSVSMSGYARTLDRWLLEVGKGMPGHSRYYAGAGLLLYGTSLFLPVIYYTHAWVGLLALLMGWGTLLVGELDLFLAYLTNFAVLILIGRCLFTKASRSPGFAILVALLAIPALLPHQIPNIENSGSQPPDAYLSLYGSYVWIGAHVLTALANLKR